MTLHCFDKEYQKLSSGIDDENLFQKEFETLSTKVQKVITSCFDKDKKIMILGDDVDNQVSAQIIYYLMKVHSMHYTKALSLVKERRISVKLAQWVHNYLKLQQMKKDEK